MVKSYREVFDKLKELGSATAKEVADSDRDTTIASVCNKLKRAARFNPNVFKEKKNVHGGKWEYEFTWTG